MLSYVDAEIVQPLEKAQITNSTTASDKKKKKKKNCRDTHLHKVGDIMLHMYTFQFLTKHSPFSVCLECYSEL